MGDRLDALERFADRAEGALTLVKFVSSLLGIGGLAAIVAGYRQVIARYMAGPPAQTPPHLTTRADNTSS
jgi:hypothetical protein